MLKARTKIMELGVFHPGVRERVPIEAYIEAASEEKVLVAV